MANKFTFEIQGLDKLTNKIKNLPAKLQKEIGGEIEDSARKINSKQLRLVPVDEGGIKQSTGVNKNNITEFELFSGKFYAPFMEFGTKKKANVPAELQEYASQFKGNGPSIGFKAFLNIIKAWIRRKGIDEKAAYPIAIKILREGVNPHPFFFQPFFDERKALIVQIKRIVDNIDSK